MAGAAEETSHLPYDGTCDACEPDEAKEAIVICDDCHFSYCDIHSAEHREKYPAHKVRDFSETSEEEDEDEETTPVEEPETKTKQNTVSEKKTCPIHKQELSLYCKDDSKIICVLCAVAGDHRQHELITLNEAYLQMKNRKPVDLKLAMGDMVEKLKEKCANSKITRSELKLFIQKEFEYMKKLVHEEETKALHFVDLKEAVASAHVTEVLAELNVHMCKLMTEMAEITQQLNSFNQLNPEDEDDDEDEETAPDSAAEGSSNARFQNPPPGNGPW